MADGSGSPSWGSRKMDEFIAWITQPGTPKGAASSTAVDPALARKHIQNVITYIDRIDHLAKAGNRDALDLMVSLSPLRSLLKAARTGAEIAAAAQASANHFESFMTALEKRSGDKAAIEGGYSANDTSWQANDQRTIGEAAVRRQQLALSRRVITYNDPSGTSIPQLMACKVERDFIHKLMFWEKTHDQAFAPCDSVRYLLQLGRN